jgi:hypothetical protein
MALFGAGDAAGFDAVEQSVARVQEEIAKGMAPL